MIWEARSSNYKVRVAEAERTVQITIEDFKDGRLWAVTTLSGLPDPELVAAQYIEETT